MKSSLILILILSLKINLIIKSNYLLTKFKIIQKQKVVIHLDVLQRFTENSEY